MNPKTERLKNPDFVVLQQSDGSGTIWCTQHEFTRLSCPVQAEVDGVIVEPVISWQTSSLFLPAKHHLNTSVSNVIPDEVPFLHGWSNTFLY